MWYSYIQIKVSILWKVLNASVLIAEAIDTDNRIGIDRIWNWEQQRRSILELSISTLALSPLPSAALISFLIRCGGISIAILCYCPRHQSAAIYYDIMRTATASRIILRLVTHMFPFAKSFRRIPYKFFCNQSTDACLLTRIAVDERPDAWFPEFGKRAVQKNQFTPFKARPHDGDHLTGKPFFCTASSGASFYFYQRSLYLYEYFKFPDTSLKTLTQVTRFRRPTLGSKRGPGDRTLSGGGFSWAPPRKSSSVKRVYYHVNGYTTWNRYGYLQPIYRVREANLCLAVAKVAKVSQWRACFGLLSRRHLPRVRTSPGWMRYQSNALSECCASNTCFSASCTWIASVKRTTSPARSFFFFSSRLNQSHSSLSLTQGENTPSSSRGR